MNKRNKILLSIAAVVLLATSIFMVAKKYKDASVLSSSIYKLPPLGYAFDALEPYIDAQTMEIHYTKHHQKYVDELNNALKDYPELRGKYLEDLLKDLDQVPEKIRASVRNNGGGHLNHSIFWFTMTPEKEKKVMSKEMKLALEKNFGSVEDFKRQFSEAAKKLFGSGWVWLVIDKDNKLSIVTTKDQDSPISQGLLPILGLDVWEHAYYLKYQNKRIDYIDAWWNVINWHDIEADGLLLRKVPVKSLR